MNDRIFLLVPLVMGGCLYSGDGTRGLPCNTDVECGGRQLCIARVCGGPEQAANETGSGESEDGSSSDGEGVPGSGDDEPTRDACDPSENACLDGDVLRVCTSEGKLETRGCAGWCGEASPSLGCFEGSDGPACGCEFERERCTPGEDTRACLGNNLVNCEDGFWNPGDCDSICVEAGYAGSDGTCGVGQAGSPVCFCADACSEGAMRCVDDDTAAWCSGGSWFEYDCTDACIESGYTFSTGCYFFYDSNTESCACA